MSPREPFSERVARRLRVEPQELPPILWAVAQFLLLLASLYVVRPIRDEMGIAGGVKNMPWLFSGTFVGILLVVPVYGWAVSRWSRRRLVPAVYTAVAATLGLFFVGFSVLPASTTPVLAAAFFIWFSVLNVLVVSVFWTLLADLFSPESSRRTFGLVAAGGTVGALLGPALVAVLVRWMQPRDLLIIAAVFILGAAGAAYRLDSAVGAVAPRDTTPVGGGLFRGFVSMLATPRLRGIAVYLLCTTWISTILYFEQAHIIEAAIPDPAQRTGLFAQMDLAVNLLALGVQTFLTGRILVRLGLVTVLVLSPLLSVGMLASLALFPALAVLVVVQVMRRAVNYALTRPAREVLYTDVDLESKYKGKNVVDTLVYRGGDAVAGWAFAGLEALGLGLSAIAWLGIPVALGWAAIGRRLGRDAETIERPA